MHHPPPISVTLPPIDCDHVTAGRSLLRAKKKMAACEKNNQTEEEKKKLFFFAFCSISYGPLCIISRQMYVLISFGLHRGGGGPEEEEKKKKEARSEALFPFLSPASFGKCDQIGATSRSPAPRR